MNNCLKNVCGFIQFTFYVSLINANYYSNNNNNNQQQYIAENPSDQQAKIGDQALLKCKIKNLRGEPQWCIDDFCLGMAKSDGMKITKEYDNTSILKGRSRYRIVGDKSKGEFNLLIEPVQLQDNMFFYCMATAASESIKAVKSKKVFLTVLTNPQSLTLENPVHVSLNKPSTIQCISRQSRPPVKILIAINGILINDESRYKTEIIQIPIKSELDKIDDNSLQEDMFSKRQKKFHIFQSFRHHSLISPEKLRESYYDTITNLTVDDVNMKMDGQTVECFAFSYTNDRSTAINKLFNSASSMKSLNLNSYQNNLMNTKSIIQVDYAPEVNLKIVSAPRLLREEDVINLVCETKATPAIQSYKWYIGKNYLNGVSDSILNLKLRKEMHLQKITCEASNIVASVKASLKLNILYKPAFIKGKQSYILVDKKACNKPLTLDCQVTSNPPSNITWYRRRLSRTFLNKNYQYFSSSNQVKHDSNKFYDSLLGMLSYKIDVNTDKYDLFEDEPIGHGPTYTIASFNCADTLQNVHNRTVKSKKSKTKAKMISLIDSIISPVTTKSDLLKKISSTTVSPKSFNNNYSIEENDYQDNEALLVNKQKRKNLQLQPLAASLNIDYPESEYDYDETEDDYFQSSNLEIDENENIKTNYNELDDFGIYVCEASNYMYINNDEPDYFNFNKQIHRYIKINPIGPPILRSLPSFINSLSFDEITNLMMKSPINGIGLDFSLKKKSQITLESSAASKSSANVDENDSKLYLINNLIEIPATLGAAAALTCFIEPLPSFEKIVWLKSNGQIMPKSKFQKANDEYEIIGTNDSNNEFSAEENEETIISSNNGLNKLKSNFKVKFDNITKYLSSTLDDFKSSIDGQSKKNNLKSFTTSTISSALTSSYQNQNGIQILNDAAGLIRTTLYIKSVRKEDLGIYKCKSTNSYGTRTAILLLREQNLIDKLSLNGQLSLIFFLIVIFLAILLLLAVVSCIFSRRFRKLLCFCCFYSNKSIKNNDKTINEWLVSSKLSNETGHECSLVNKVANHTNNITSASSTSTGTVHINDINSRQIDESSCDSGIISTKISKPNELFANTPELRENHHDGVNCSTSLLNEDIDDQNDDNIHSINQNQNSDNNQKNAINTSISSTITKHSIVNPSGTNITSNESNTMNSTLKRINPISTFYQSTNQSYTGTPKFSTCNINVTKNIVNEDSTMTLDHLIDDNKKHSNETKLATSSVEKFTSMVFNKNSTLRKGIFTNGNFNAKISTSDTKNNNNYSITQTIMSTPRLNNEQFMSSYVTQTNNDSNNYQNNTLIKNQYQLNGNNINTNNRYDELELEKDYYENNIVETTDLIFSNKNILQNKNEINKLINEKAYRISDLLNELSPSLISSNKIEKNSIYSNNFQQYPNSPKIKSHSTGLLKHQNNPTNQQPPLVPSRQTLIQAVNSNNLNKFPNPFLNCDINFITDSSNENAFQTSLNKAGNFHSNFYKISSQEASGTIPSPINSPPLSNHRCNHLDI